MTEEKEGNAFKAGFIDVLNKTNISHIAYVDISGKYLSVAYPVSLSYIGSALWSRNQGFLPPAYIGIPDKHAPEGKGYRVIKSLEDVFRILLEESC